MALITHLKNIFASDSDLTTEYETIQGRKPSQEDSFYISDCINDRRFMFVADGVGGHGHGDFASKTVVGIFKEAFENMPLQISIPVFLKKTLYSAAEIVLDKSKQDASYANCGTTVSGFFVTGHSYYTINVGDSRVYLYSKDILSRETHDHSIVQQLLDSGQITEEEAFVHPQRNMMTSAVGQSIDMMTVDVEGPRPLEHGDILMAFSDGVHDALTDTEILSLTNNYKNKNGLAKALVESAYNAGGKDNITALIYKFLS